MERITKTKEKVLRHKKRIKSFVCLLMAVVMFISLLPVKTNAFSINGAGTGVVTGTGTETGSYGYRSAEGLLGFRATLVDSLGNTVPNTGSYDVYSSSLSTRTLVRFTTKYSKTELIRLYSMLNFPLTTTSSATVYNSDTISASSWGLSIPVSAQAMIDWATKANMKTLLEKAWATGTDELASQGWAVMMEPIYELKIEGTWFALTPTEMAIVAVADGSSYSSPTNYWDNIPGWSATDNDINTWKYVSGYTHGAWPQALTLTKEQCGIAAPSKTLTKSSRGTSRQIIEEGYGVMLVYAENLHPNDYTLKVDPNGGTYKGSTAVTTETHAAGDEVSIGAPTRPGYTFNGWVWSGNTTSVTLDQPTIGYAKENFTGHGTYKQTVNATEGYTNHKWTGIPTQTSDAWNYITLSNYSISAGETITVSGWMRINKNTTGAALNFYHGAKNNDWQNNKFGASSTDGQWQYFSFSRTFEAVTTGYLQIYTGTLNGRSGDIDFDLRGISIKRSNGTIVPTVLTMPASDITLTAKWTPNEYTLTFDPNNGTLPNPGTNLYSSLNAGNSVTVTYNETDYCAMNGDIPTREGYTFAGWNTKADGSGEQVYDANGYAVRNGTYFNEHNRWAYTGNLTVYAQWFKSGATYTVNHYQMDTSGKYPDTPTDTETQAGTTDETLTLEELAKSYTGFKYVEGKVDGNVVTTTTILADGSRVIDLYYARNTYTITLDKQSGSGGTPTVYEVYGSKFYTNTTSMDAVTSVTVPTRAGYTFGGYYTGTNGSGTQIIDANGKILVGNTYFTANATIYAKWTASTDTTYTVNHYQMDTSGTYPDTPTATETKMGTTGASLTLKNLAKSYTGFTYMVGKVGGSVVTTTTILADGSRVVDLYYARNLYEVELLRGTGITSVSGAGTYCYGETVTINAEVAAGYTWSTWVGTHNTTTKQYMFTMPANNVTNTALAGGNTYTITLDKQSGSSGTSTVYEVYGSKFYTNTTSMAAVTSVNEPIRDGYVFGGYYTGTGGSGTQIIDANGKILVGNTYFTANTTIYACWLMGVPGESPEGPQASFLINHYQMDTTGKYPDAPTVTVVEFGAPGATLTLADLAKSYTGFKYVEGKVDGNVVTTTTILADGSRVIDLYYARNQYTVTLNKVGVSSVSGAGTYYYGESVTIDAEVSAGKTWVRWSGTCPSTKKQYTFTMPANDVTNTAYAHVNQYTIEYDGNGATSGATEPSTHTCNVEKNLTANGFARTGYTFTGWNREADGSGTAYEDQQSVKNLSYVHNVTITLYAQWKPINYTVTFNSNGGTGTMADQVFVYDEEQTLTANAFTWAGHTFKGWATSTDGEVVFEDQQAVKNLTATDGAVIVLYAVWNGGEDEGPEIIAVDRWFTLAEARANAITIEELMSTAEAKDSPIGDVTDFSEKKDNFTIIDYDAADFRSFSGAGSVTITYRAEDNAGNIALKTVTVHIVDKNNSSILNSSNGVKNQEIRFISDRYYLDGNGDFIGASSGGLGVHSKWITDSAYVDALSNTLKNSHNNGKWTTKPAYTFIFDTGAIIDIKAFMDANEFGKSLGAFYNAFLK